eukprot:6206730-Pleurochrysis_carterae.AAC.1
MRLECARCATYSSSVLREEPSQIWMHAVELFCFPSLSDVSFHFYRATSRFKAISCPSTCLALYLIAFLTVRSV